MRVSLQRRHSDQVREVAAESDASVSDVAALAIADATEDLQAMVGEARVDQLPQLTRFVRGATSGVQDTPLDVEVAPDVLRDFRVLITLRTGARLSEAQAVTAAIAWWLRPRTPFSRHGGEVHTKRCA